MRLQKCNKNVANLQNLAAIVFLGLFRFFWQIMLMMTAEFIVHYFVFVAINTH